MKQILLTLTISGCLIRSCLTAQSTYTLVYDFQEKFEFPLGIAINSDSTFLVSTTATDYDYENKGLLFSIADANGSIIEYKYSCFDNLFWYQQLPGSIEYDDNDTYFSTGTLEDQTTFDDDIRFILYDSTGDTLLFRRYADSLNSSGKASCLAADNGYFVAGTVAAPDSPKNVLLVRLDSAANWLWSKEYDSGTDDRTMNVEVLPNNDLIIAINRQTYANQIRPWILIVDSLGNVKKDKRFDEDFYEGGCGTVLPIGINNYLLIAATYLTYPADVFTPKNIFVSRLDEYLKPIWTTVFTDSASTYNYSTRILSDSSIVLVGAKAIPYSSWTHGWIAKLDKNGNILWPREYFHGDVNTSCWNYFSDFRELWDGGFIIAGTTMDGLTSDTWLVRLDSNGCLVPGCEMNAAAFEVSDTDTSLKIFPNLARGSVTEMYRTPPGQGSLTILDAFGRRVESCEIQSGEHQMLLNLSGYAPGLYVTELKTAVRRVIKKLLVQ